MARRGRRRFTRGDHEYVWTAVLATADGISGGTAEERVIVTGADWFGGAGDGEATLMRIRGCVSYCPGVGTESAGLMWGYAVFKCPASQSAFAIPLSATDLVDQDILDVRYTSHGRSATGVAMYPGRFFFDVDIKAMRRINASDEVRMAVWCSGAVAGTYTVEARGLVRI